MYKLAAASDVHLIKTCSPSAGMWEEWQWPGSGCHIENENQILKAHGLLVVSSSGSI